MHTFQQYPADLLEINPFTKFSKEWALVSAGDKTKANTMPPLFLQATLLWLSLNFPANF